MVVSRDSENLIKLFEELGFEKKHQPVADAGKGEVTTTRMKDVNGFCIDIVGSDGSIPDFTEIRINVDDLKEACDKAGFEFSLSQAEKGYEKVSYLYRENLEIQAVYKDDEDNIGYYVIKANGNSDVSGDYNSYENIEKVTTDGKKVTLKGNKGKWSTATWTKGGFSYAIVGSNKTFSKEKILEIAGKTR
jgi:hypothetical protein